MNFFASSSTSGSFTPYDLFHTIWTFLSSQIALFVYLAIILILVMILSIVMMKNEKEQYKVISYGEQVKTHAKVTSRVSTKDAVQVVSNYSIAAPSPVTSTFMPAPTANSFFPKLEEEKEEEESTNRFFMLSQLDEVKKEYSKIKEDKKLTLDKICEDFRNFASNQLKLYYDIDDIRRFIANLAVTHIMILQGMSGTGKTSLAVAFGKFIKNYTTVVPIQPMWKERTDLIGYYNEFTKRFNETVLLQKMYEANYDNKIYVVTLDEMNIARVEYYFAEFLSLLELPDLDARNLDVVSDKWESDPKLLRNGQLKLPPNMWFIGTANNDDSTFAISDKVYDRAMVMNLDAKTKTFEAPYTNPINLSADQFNKLVKEAIVEYRLSERNLRRIGELDKYLISKFHITFGNRIMKQIKTYIPTYVACGGTELEALDDILAKKVLRKLEAQNPVYVRSAADGFCNYLDELFGNNKMPLCKAYIRRLEMNA